MASSFVAGRHATAELCKALDLDPTRPIRSVTIRSDMHEAVVAVVEMYVTVEQAGRVGEVLSRYRLEPKDGR